MKRLLVASAAFFFATSAFAQNAGTVTSNAFAVGRGAGKTGFASVLCTQAQLAVGQNAAAPICRTLTGDVTIDATGATAIGSNKLTNAQLATATDGTIKSNISGGTAAPSDNSISAVLDKLFGTTRGSIIYRGASTWSALAPGTSGFFLKSNGAGADPAYAAASGSGTVTSAQISAGTGISVSGTCTITTTGNCTVARLFTSATVQVTGSAPANTGSTTAVMSGFGSTCTLTPVLNGRMDITIIFAGSNNTAGNSGTYDIRYGTGAAPAANAAVTGTQAISAITAGYPTANASVITTLRAIVTGLSTGTAYWIDLSRFTNANTLNIAANGITCSAFEF